MTDSYRGDIDIGGGHRIAFTESDGQPYGIVDFHNKPDGTECWGGSIMFDLPQNAHVPDRAKWQVESMDPLTLSPSLLCTLCGSHGYIREGRWVAC